MTWWEWEGMKTLHFPVSHTQVAKHCWLMDSCFCSIRMGTEWNGNSRREWEQNQAKTWIRNGTFPVLISTMCIHNAWYCTVTSNLADTRITYPSVYRCPDPCNIHMDCVDLHGLLRTVVTVVWNCRQCSKTGSSFCRLQSVWTQQYFTCVK